jgi:hypothetical protein
MKPPVLYAACKIPVPRAKGAHLERRYFLSAGREFRFEKEYAKPASGTIAERMPEKPEAIRIS